MNTFNCKFLILLFGLVISIPLSSQVKIVFEYDAAGNQIQRKLAPDVIDICVSCPPIDSLEDTFVKMAQSPKEALQNSLKIYPNPTQGLFYMEWDQQYSGFIVSIQIQAYNTNYSQNLPFDSQNAKAYFDITNQTAGLYYVKFLLTDGSFVSQTLIKQ